MAKMSENAMKYKSTRVDVKITTCGSQVQISITNDGEFVPQKDLPHIFERFYRVDKSRNRNTGGSGIGLALTESIVQTLGGTITATSSENDGTQMIVNLSK